VLGTKLFLGGTQDFCELDWREVDGCLLLRNRDWYAEEAQRPPLSLRLWLRDLQNKGNPYVLSPADLTRLLFIAMPLLADCAGCASCQAAAKSRRNAHC